MKNTGHGNPSALEVADLEAIRDKAEELLAQLFHERGIQVLSFRGNRGVVNGLRIILLDAERSKD